MGQRTDKNLYYSLPLDSYYSGFLGPDHYNRCIFSEFLTQARRIQHYIWILGPYRQLETSWLEPTSGFWRFIDYPIYNRLFLEDFQPPQSQRNDEKIVFLLHMAVELGRKTGC